MSKRIDLSERDIDYIERVVATEVPESVARKDPAAYRDMVGAVVDTITNRLATGRYGSTVSKIANAPAQFSAINGPKRAGQKAPYGSVQNAPASNARVKEAVSSHLGARAQGAPSKIGGATDFANPNVSDARNVRGWVGGMIDRGAVPLGVGTDVHYHGLSPTSRPAPAHTIGLPAGYARSTVGPYDSARTAYPASLEYSTPGTRIAGRVPTPMTAPRDIPTAAAYGPMRPTTGALAAIDRAMTPRSVPSPTAAPRAPTRSPPADIGGRVLATPRNIPTPASRPTTASPLTAAQSRNLADRLAPQSSLAMAPRPTNAPRSVSVAAPSAVQPAAALPTGLRAAPPSTPRAVSVAAPASVQRAASLPTGLQSSRVSPAVAADRAVSAATPDGVTRAASLPSGLQSARGARVAPASVSRSTPLTTKQAVNLASRLGPMQATVGAAALREARKADSPATATSLLGVTPAAAATRTPTTVAAPAAVAPSRTNFAGPAGSIRSMDTRAVTPMTQRSVPTPTSRPAPTTNFAGRVGSPRAVEGSSAAARPVATPAARPASVASVAPARSNFAGSAGSIRSLDARPTINPASPPSLAPAPAYRSSVPGPISSPAPHYSALASVAPSIPTPTSRPPVQGPVRPAIQGPVRPATEARVVSAPARIATPTARPAIAAPAAIGTITSRPAPPARAISVAAAPQAARSVATPTARDHWGGLRTGVVSPSAPTADQQAQQPAGITSRLGLTPGRIAGSVMGGAIAGPIGAIAGGCLGGRLAGAPTPGPAQSAMGSFGGLGGLGEMNGMGSMGGFGNQGSSLNGAGMAGGNRDRTGGFGGFGERDSAVGNDGGKVGGSSRSSSSSGGKSSSSGGKGKK